MPRTTPPRAPFLAGLLVVAALVAPDPAPARAGPSGPAGQEGPPTDTVVVVVSSRSPVTSISRLHLADLYLGRASRFDDGRPAAPIDLEPGTPAREAFYQRYLQRSPAEIEAHWARLVFTGRGRPPPDVESGREMRERVAADPRAVGYLDRSLVDASVRVVKIR